MFLVHATGAQTGCELFRGFRAPGLAVDPLHQSFRHRPAQRNGMDAPAHRIVLFPRFPQQLVEYGCGTTLGGDQTELSAPGSHRLGYAVEQPLILMQGELVQLHVTPFPRQCIWIR
ncbi:hypothetical protein SDC9_165305 [bioreactor metagenome]|uniref:Uncharacterized protein n=1 Tax=bioreactor metagenome TaxID=1076179 RepID=A0A645FTY8_9ZZZZ